MNTPASIKFGEVAKFIRGITFKPTDVVEPYSQGSAVCMRTKNIQTDLDQNDLIAIPKTFIKRKEQFLVEGDILVSSANSWELVGKCSWVPKLAYEATAGGFISILRAEKKRVDARYLYHWLNLPQIQFKLRYCGRQTTNISNLNFAQALELEIPFPPLTEQKRISAILDKVDAIRRKRQQAIKVADDFIHATFLDMFGDIPAKISKHPFSPIRSYCEARSGKSSRSVLSKEKTDYPIYGGNGINGWATLPLYEEPVIVLGRVGQQCGIVHYTTGPAWVTDNAIVLKILDKRRLHPVYLAAALQNSPLRATVERLDLPFINQTMVLDYPLPLPSIGEQNKYIRLVSRIMSINSVETESLKKMNGLFNSLSQRAFIGKL
ncbi:MAG: restriction endonuclease subunit S [Desulfobacterales bacterium]|nr:restriction endonuclease subunit S [Desulfobacterales bacterium]